MRPYEAASIRSWLLLLLSVTAAYAHVWLLGVVRTLPYAEPLAYVLLGALFFRHRAPYTVLLVTLPLGCLQGLSLGSLIALHAVALHYEGGRRLGTASVLVFLSAQPYFLFSQYWGEGVSTPSWEQRCTSFVGMGMMVGVPVATGVLVRSRADIAARLAYLTRAREREQAFLVDQALSAERARLAREMHDVVAHQVSLINVQVGALQVTTADPQARELAGSVRLLSAKALDELRQMVGVLRASGATVDALGPQPLLRDLPALIADSQLDTDDHLCVPLEGPWHEAVQRAAYRTVQEGLTNVRKHAPGARVEIRLHETDHHLHVVVRSGPPDPSVPPPGLASGGYGLIGLRERAQLLNGTLRAGPDGDGGFLLHASFPTQKSPTGQAQTLP
ncbi:sensor histidine kinase [Streptomyces sp. NRRL B-1347]|uniref:sensor histidine kinase n=1 Tax=Streptomyces sp. NRRL B-1347 TaxID=1476877 RepID=UPI00068E5522|nr:histidine kinase [Streptomyces sp. NRRL B-1347]